MTHEMLEDSVPGIQEQYVDELAHEEDCWLSIADAARYTRRQEDTIRRWIKAGLLPIRRTSNQQPHQIRMSDIEEMVPLVDKALVATSDQGHSTLISPPAEQATIKGMQQRLLYQLDRLQQEFEEQARKHTLSLAEQVRQHQQALCLFRETVEQWQDEQRTQLLRQLEDQTQKLFQTLEATEQLLTEHTQRMKEQDQRFLQLQETVGQSQERASQWQDDVMQQQQEAAQVIETQQEDLAELTARQEQLEQRIGQLEELFHNLSTQLVWQGELVQQQYQKLTDNLANWSEQIETWQQETSARLDQVQYAFQAQDDAEAPLSLHDHVASENPEPEQHSQSLQEHKTEQEQNVEEQREQSRQQQELLNDFALRLERLETAIEKLEILAHEDQ